MEFVRDRSARLLIAMNRIFDSRVPYIGFLIAGLGTFGCLLARAPWVLATTFLAYLAALAAFTLLERWRSIRAIAALDRIATEEGPTADPAATRDLPRYLLASRDAESLQLLDAILVPRGDSMVAFRTLTRRVTRVGITYALPLGLFFFGVPLVAVAIAVGVGERLGFEPIVSEVVLIVLAISPSLVLAETRGRYRRWARLYNASRVREATRIVASLPAPERPFLDGIAIRFRENGYIVDGTVLSPPAGKENPRVRGNELMGVVMWVILPTAVAVLAFVIHPFSGILDR